MYAIDPVASFGPLGGAVGGPVGGPRPVPGRLVASILASLVAMATAARPAAADEPAHPERIIVGGKLGGIAPFDGLSPFVSVGVEVGYVLPVADHRIAVALTADYTQPTTTGREPDPRVTGGAYTWKLTEQELGIMPVVVYRLMAIKGVVPYGGIGPRLLLARSVVRDNGTPAIMETTEHSTRFGVGVPLGAELALGPGRAIGELLLQYGTLNHVATGDANTGAVSASVGYRLAF